MSHISRQIRSGRQYPPASCVGPLFHVATDAGLNRGNALTEGYRAAFTAVLPDLEYPTLEFRFPIFIGTGERDRDVARSRQKRLVREACAAGSIIEAHLYRGLDHSQTVNASLKDSVPFVRKVLAGEPIHPVCEPAPE